MDEKRKYLKIEEYEQARLYRLDGRVDAVQEYVDREEFPNLDTVLAILGIDTTKMEIKRERRKEEMLRVTSVDAEVQSNAEKE